MSLIMARTYRTRPTQYYRHRCMFLHPCEFAHIETYMVLQKKLNVRPDSNLTLFAAREVTEEEGFDELLDGVRDRIDEIESLHRTRELTVSACHDSVPHVTDLSYRFSSRTSTRATWYVYLSINAARKSRGPLMEIINSLLSRRWYRLGKFFQCTFTFFTSFRLSSNYIYFLDCEHTFVVLSCIYSFDHLFCYYLYSDMLIFVSPIDPSHIQQAPITQFRRTFTRITRGKRGE